MLKYEKIWKFNLHKLNLHKSAVWKMAVERATS